MQRFDATIQYLMNEGSDRSNFLFMLQFTYQRFLTIVSQLAPQFKWEMWPIYNSISSRTEKNEHYRFVSGEEIQISTSQAHQQVNKQMQLLHCVITYHDVVLLDCSKTRIMA